MLPIANPVRPSQCPCRAGELAGDEARVASRGSARQHAAGQQQQRSSGLSADRESALESLGRTQQAELAGLRAQVPMRPSKMKRASCRWGTAGHHRLRWLHRKAQGCPAHPGGGAQRLGSHREAVAVEPGRA